MEPSLCRQVARIVVFGDVINFANFFRLVVVKRATLGHHAYYETLSAILYPVFRRDDMVNQSGILITNWSEECRNKSERKIALV